MKGNKTQNIKISIGIPAYNEAANIKKLLWSLLSQIEVEYTLAEIIVVSDGSVDTTVEQIRSIKNDKIVLLNHTTRQGKSQSLNEILAAFTGDVLFLLDADIKIYDSFLFAKIIKNTDMQKAGLVGINAIPVKAENNFQEIVNAGVYAMKDIAKLWKGGKNYLSFKGCFLGLHKSLAKNIRVDQSVVNNDAYFYLIAKKMGYSPTCYADASVYYTSPMNWSDHVKQTERFKSSKEEMEAYFKRNLDAEYNIPMVIYMKVIAKHILLNPYYFLNYLMIKAITQLKKSGKSSYMWHVALSTKK